MNYVIKYIFFQANGRLKLIECVQAFSKLDKFQRVKY